MADDTEGVGRRGRRGIPLLYDSCTLSTIASLRTYPVVVGLFKKWMEAKLLKLFFFFV